LDTLIGVSRTRWTVWAEDERPELAAAIVKRDEAQEEERQRAEEARLAEESARRRAEKARLTKERRMKEQETRRVEAERVKYLVKHRRKAVRNSPTTQNCQVLYRRLRASSRRMHCNTIRGNSVQKSGTRFVSPELCPR